MIFSRRAPPRPPLRTEATRSTRLDRHVAGQVQADGPGLALAVAISGRVAHAAGYGLADLGSGTPIEQSTIFHLASCGKQFTALGILMLAEEGRLGLDDPIGKHIPALSGFGPGVTLTTLLHHTSGIRDLYDEDGVEEVLARCERPSNADVIRTYADLGCPLAGWRAKPGSAFNYSNSGYELLGSVIERVSRQSYHDFFQARVFDRLGMKDTFSIPDRRIDDGRCAVGYALDEDGALVAVGHGSNEFDDLVGAGSFYTTVLDLCRYDRALTANSLVSEASMRLALTSGRTNDGAPTNYGFGWYFGAQDGMSFADHEGSWNGCYAYVCRYLDRPLSIFVLANNPDVDLLAVSDAAIDALVEPGS
jgi:CubicO group peptidase (beta-lactamase class C family)